METPKPAEWTGCHLNTERQASFGQWLVAHDDLDEEELHETEIYVGSKPFKEKRYKGWPQNEAYYSCHRIKAD